MRWKFLKVFFCSKTGCGERVLNMFAMLHSPPHQVISICDDDNDLYNFYMMLAQTLPETVTPSFQAASCTQEELSFIPFHFHHWLLTSKPSFKPWGGAPIVALLVMTVLQLFLLLLTFAAWCFLRESWGFAASQVCFLVSPFVCSWQKCRKNGKQTINF